MYNSPETEEKEKTEQTIMKYSLAIVTFAELHEVLLYA
jgi:hypothetical protein